MVDGDRVGHLLKESGLAGFRWRDDQTALTFAKWGDQLGDPRLDDFRIGLEIEPFERIDADELGERNRLVPVLLGLESFDRLDRGHSRPVT